MEPEKVVALETVVPTLGSVVAVGSGWAAPAAAGWEGCVVQVSP